MQSIVTPLLAVITACARQPRIRIRASWLKREDPNVVYAIVGTSLVDSTDLVQGASSVITNADLFDYMDESDYAMLVEYDRRIDEPRGGTSHAIANIVLDNITRRFSPNENATIGTAIEARRPFKFSIGFNAEGADRFAQVMVGLTSKRPEEKRTTRVVEIEVFDYITFIDNSTLGAAIYENQRSDQIIDSILTDLGFGASQKSLDTGINTIPFAWFDKDKTAGQRIRDICEAEEGHFYQDENGILRFENRNHYSNAPHATVQRTIDPDDILDDQEDDSTPIINRSVVIAKPRKVDASVSVIWAHATEESIAAQASLTIWAAFFDSEGGQNPLPIKEITTPAASTDYTANSQSGGGGSDMTSDIDVTVTNFVESAKIVLTNNHATDTAYITLLQLRGKAARVTQGIQAIKEDSDSINKYEAQVYTLRNDLIQSRATAQTIADNLTNRYKNPLRRRKITIPGIPHLQLKDLVEVVNPNPKNLIPNGNFEGGTDNWSVVAGGLSTTLSQARDIAVYEGAYMLKLVAT